MSVFRVKAGSHGPLMRVMDVNWSQNLEFLMNPNKTLSQSAIFAEDFKNHIIGQLKKNLKFKKNKLY